MRVVGSGSRISTIPLQGPKTVGPIALFTVCKHIRDGNNILSTSLFNF